MRTRKTVIFMGYSCNNNCIFCCNSERRLNIADETTEKIKQQMLEAKNNGSDYLELIGGEPTIRKDILELVKYAKRLKFSTIMFATNGRMFAYKDFAQKLLGAGLNHIVFSIHGHTKELHDGLTKAPGSFEQLNRGLDNLKQLNFTNIGSNTTIVKQNYKHLDKIGEFIYSKGIRNAEFIFVDPTRGHPKDNFNDLVPGYEESSPYINKLLAFGKKHSIPHWDISYYPLCFIQEKYHDMISEIKEKKTFDAEHIAPDFENRHVEESRETASRQKTEKCINCRYAEYCEGFWKEYLKQAPEVGR